MQAETHKTRFADIVTALREQLVAARAARDIPKLTRLQTTFASLIESAYDRSPAETINVLVDLEDAARDALMGVDWKSDIPSLETIQTLV